jgi:hypothetical protein
MGGRGISHTKKKTVHGLGETVSSFIYVCVDEGKKKEKKETMENPHPRGRDFHIIVVLLFFLLITLTHVLCNLKTIN